MSFRFPKTQHLRKAPDIRKVLASGRKIGADGFVIKWLPRTENAEESRICVTVRKKEVKAAVKRNRIRRLVKEFFRHYSSKLIAPVDLVVQVSFYKALKYKEIENFFKTNLKRAKLLS